MGIAFGGVQEVSEGVGEFQPMPENVVFVMDIIESEEQVSKKGNAMFRVTLQPVDEKYSNRKIWDFLVEGASFDKKIGNLLASAGKDFTRGGTIEAHHLIGLQVRVKLKHESWEGRINEKVAFYVPRSKATDVAKAPTEAMSAVAPVPPSGEDVPF